MKEWMVSINSVITVSLISLLVFLGRTFFDFYYVYPEFNLGISVLTLIILANMALFGGWIWSLLSAVRGSRRGLILVLVFDIFFLVVIAVGTLVSYCPSPCQTAWPLGEYANWTSLIIGLLAAFVVGYNLWRNVEPPDNYSTL